MDSTYLMSSVAGLVSSKRRLTRPPKSRARPKFRQIDFACPMCRNPLGSGGNRVATCRPNRFVSTSSATRSRIKLFRGAFESVTVRRMGAFVGKAKALIVGIANLANHANLHESFNRSQQEFAAIREIRWIRDKYDQRLSGLETLNV